MLITSVPEGDDKPYKYPGVYHGVQALVPEQDRFAAVHSLFNMDYFLQGVEILNPGIKTFPLSCRTGEGLEAWTDWLLESVGAARRKAD